MTTRKGALLITLTLALAGFSNATPLDEFSVDFERCRDDKFPTNQVLDRFTGIFFGDFTTYNSLGSLGPLAVKGDFSAPNYIVNANHGAICSRTRSFPSYALVVGGNVNTQNTMTYGSAYINGTGNLDQVIIGEKGCSVFDNKKTGVFSFPSVEEDLLLASQEFAKHEPTAFLLKTGTLTPFKNRQMDNYEILTFHTCGQTICSNFPQLESQPDGMFFGQGDWKGTNSPVNRAKTYVYNIPVANGDTITLDTTNPSAGLNICNVIFNFYPVDNNGQYLPDGEFTLLRRTGGQLEGLTLAPRGNIIDGSVGNFAGNVVGKSYTWEKPSDGVELHDMKAGGGSCEAYSGCMPFFLPPGISKTTSRKTTTTKTTTKTTSKKATTTTEGDIDTVINTLTNTVTMLQPATTTVTATLSQNIATTTTTLVQQGGQVSTVTLTQDGATVTLERDPKTVEIVIDHEPSTITESGKTVVLPGQNRTVTQEPEEQLTTEVYTTTITESGSTFVSLVTTTRVLPGQEGGVITLIGPGNIIETTTVATAVPITVTETIFEWYPRKHYHQGSDEACYDDDEEEEEDEEDYDEVYNEDEDYYDGHKDEYRNK